MSSEISTLYYVHDPMCSWCWGLRPVWKQVQEAIKGKVIVRYVLGGLAPDNDQPMLDSMQVSIKETWRTIEKDIPGTEFNYDFWAVCKPRRSTYPSCRAVIAAGLQGQQHEKSMLLAIQQAYYLQAKNPSDETVLIQLADEIGLDVKQFETDLLSDDCNKLLKDQITLTQHLGVNGFPSLVLSNKEHNTLININYTDSEAIVSSILKLI